MSKTRSPIFIALAATALTLLLAAALVAWRMVTPADPAIRTGMQQGAPWQIEKLEAGQIRVMGLALRGSTLAELRQRWGGDLKVALMGTREAQHEGPVALEAYVERFETGGVNGRLLLRFDTEALASRVAHWRETLPGIPQESGTRQHTLTEAALADLGASALVGVSYIPDAQLSAEVLQARFGEPAERLAEGDRLQHWLYPARGLAVVLDAKGREVLQYVAPAEFEARLAAPLRAVARPR